MKEILQPGTPGFRQGFKKTNQTNLPEIGKLPPQALDLEEAVLGALMLEASALNSVIDFLKPESFYKEAHQKIFKAIQNLFQKSIPVDILTVVQELKVNGDLEMVGGVEYIPRLTNRVASSANIEFHARIIAQKFIQRELIRISSEIIKDAYSDHTDIFDLLDKAEKNLFAVTDGNLRKEHEKMPDLLKKAIENIEKASKQKDGLTGIATGLTDLDRITNGWQKSDLIIIAARPGMGKTAFVLSIARNAAIDFKTPIAVFSLEMPSIQLVNRLIISETMLPAKKIKTGKLESYEWEQLNSKIRKLSEANIYIDDTPALTIFELRAKARRLKAQHKIELIVIDYLQLMVGGSDARGNREQEISGISRSLKSIAKELEIPVIALSQLNRSVETRGGDKKPQLSDLRESGAIEQDADMVIFLYRPEYYNINTDEAGNSLEGIGEIIIAKNRNGANDTVRVKYLSHLMKFTNLENNYSTDEDSSSIEDTSDQPPTKTVSSRMNHNFDNEVPF